MKASQRFQRLSLPALAIAVSAAGIAGPSHAAQYFAFTPLLDAGGDAGVPSPEGCTTDSGIPRGTLSGSSAGSRCHSGTPSLHEMPGDPPSAQFDSPALAEPLHLDAAQIVLYNIIDQPAAGSVSLHYFLAEVTPGVPETVTIIGEVGVENVSPGVVRRYASPVDLRDPDHVVPAGHSLRVLIGTRSTNNDFDAEGRVRILYGDQPLVDGSSPYASYADAGITFFDGTPDAFAFADRTGAEPRAWVTSAPVTIRGFDGPASIRYFPGGEYSVGCDGTFTDGYGDTGEINNGEVICVRQRASSQLGDSNTVTLTIGHTEGTFTVVTRAADTVPGAFSLSDLTNVTPGTQVTSAPVTISGIEADVPVSVSGGQYSVGCSGTFTASVGSVANGQTVCVRHIASGAYATAVDTVLTVGGVSDTFTSTTVAAPPVTDAGGSGGGGSLPAAPLLLLLLGALARRGRWMGKSP